jgi:hypothetical protein
MTHIDIASGRFANNCERLRQNILRPFARLYGGLELRRFGLQRLIIKLLYLLFECTGLPRYNRIGLNQPLVTGTKYLYENFAYLVKH